MLKFLKDKFIKFWTDEVATSRPFISQYNNIIDHIRPGDIILSEGNTRSALLIKKMTQSPWTHVSLYLGRLHDIESECMRNKIIEAYNPAPNEQLIFESFFGRGNYIDNIQILKTKHIRLCRPYQISHSDIQHVLNYAINHLGADYNLRHLLDLGRFVFAAKYIPRKWNSTLFEKDDSSAREEICSGIIAKAFMSVHYPILPSFQSTNLKHQEFIHRNPKLFIPADFDYSPYFKIIKFPKFHAYETPVYHHLPWNEEYMSNDDLGISENIHNLNKSTSKMDGTTKNDYHKHY